MFSSLFRLLATTLLRQQHFLEGRTLKEKASRVVKSEESRTWLGSDANALKIPATTINFVPRQSLETSVRTAEHGL